MNDELIVIIDEKNLAVLETVSKKKGISYSKGKRMGSGDGSQEECFLYPIFCESIEDGIELLIAYIEKKGEKSPNEIIPDEVLQHPAFQDTLLLL